MEVFTQILGIIGFICFASSYQAKKFNHIIICQIIGCVFFSAQFFLLKGYSAGMLNALCIFRYLGYLIFQDNKKRSTFTVVISICFVIATAASISYLGEVWYVGVVICIASLVGNVALLTKDQKIYKMAIFFCISPCWLFNAIYYLSIGSIIAEVFSLISILIYVIRRKPKKV